MNEYHKELELGISLAKKAPKIPEWFKQKGFISFEKKDHSPVTLADLATQSYIIYNLKKQFPQDLILAEEESSIIDKDLEKIILECFDDLKIPIENPKEIINYRGNSSKRKWIIDPIDGTQGYIEGLSYAIGIGFIDGSQPTISVISVPNYDERGLAIFYAERGKGAKASYGKRPFNQIHVSDTQYLEEVRMCHSLHYDKPWVLDFARKMGINKFIRIDSMAKFCKVASGKADLYIKPIDRDHSFIWDFLPGDLLVRESGGIVSDLTNNRLWFEGNILKWKSPGIIASNGIIHEKIIDNLKKLHISGDSFV
jgi:3'-phosphoadenosine 5'-phosphosulfate (PAPS) 3'-phosphatase